jgi:hypothetical protein
MVECVVVKNSELWILVESVLDEHSVVDCICVAPHECMVSCCGGLILGRKNVLADSAYRQLDSCCVAFALWTERSKHFKESVSNFSLWCSMRDVKSDLRWFGIMK